MLYPKEDKQEKKLLFACRNCEHQEDSQSYCIYRHQVMHVTGEETQMVSDVANDPTLPRTRNVACPKCSYQECVYFQSRARRADTTMTLYFVCCNPVCGHRFVQTTNS